VPVPRKPLARFRRNCWKAIILIALVRVADAAIGLDLLTTGPSHAGAPSIEISETR
jgi:hypothetical protein